MQATCITYLNKVLHDQANATHNLLILARYLDYSFSWMWTTLNENFYVCTTFLEHSMTEHLLPDNINVFWQPRCSYKTSTATDTNLFGQIPFEMTMMLQVRHQKWHYPDRKHLASHKRWFSTLVTLLGVSLHCSPLVHEWVAVFDTSCLVD